MNIGKQEKDQLQVAGVIVMLALYALFIFMLVFMVSRCASAASLEQIAGNPEKQSTVYLDLDSVTVERVKEGVVLKAMLVYKTGATGPFRVASGVLYHECKAMVGATYSVVGGIETMTRWDFRGRSPNGPFTIGEAVAIELCDRLLKWERS